MTSPPLSSEPPRVVICDPHPLFSQALAHELTTAGVAEVEHVTSDSTDLERVITEGSATALIIEPFPGVRDEQRVLQDLHALDIELICIGLSAVEDADRASHAVRAGLDSYLFKSKGVAWIVGAIGAALDGATVFATTVTPGRSRSTLTRRETEILQLLSRGLANKEIAKELFVTETTVKFHTTGIKRKLGVPNRTAAVATALRQGIII